MTRTALTVFLTLALPSAALAAPGGHHEAQRDRDALRDDLRDEQRAAALLREFDQASVLRDGRRLGVIEERVWQALEVERREAYRETGQAARELQRDRWEMNRDGREAAEDGRAGAHPEYHQDVRELSHDRRELADDRGDLIERADYRNRIQALTGEWARLRGHRSPRAMQRKHDMLVELVQLSRREIREDMNELREDGGGHRR